MTHNHNPLPATMAKAISEVARPYQDRSYRIPADCAQDQLMGRTALAMAARQARTAFEVGRTYTGRSVCDYDCIFAITVAKRSAKTITTTAGKRLGVKLMDGVEFVHPLGRYSMAPVITAGRP